MPAVIFASRLNDCPVLAYFNVWQPCRAPGGLSANRKLSRNGHMRGAWGRSTSGATIGVIGVSIPAASVFAKINGNSVLVWMKNLEGFAQAQNATASRARQPTIQPTMCDVLYDFRELWQFPRPCKLLTQ